MARIENSKIQVSLDNDSKRLLRNLTKAVDRLARSRWDESGGRSGVKRLVEPALSDDNENHPRGEKPSFASGGYVSAATIPEPDKGSYIPGNRIELDADAVNALRVAVGKYNALG